MKKTLLLLAACCLTVACSKKTQPKEQSEAISVQQSVPGDSTLYGLACEGSTDSLLVILPYSGGDPDTFDIIRAFEEHRLYGRPHVGDKLAVILNPDSVQEVMMTINISTLIGQWGYQATPTLRQNAQSRPIPDSILQRIMAPREYGIRLKNGGSAHTIGMGRQQANDGMSPVRYPTQKRYESWQLYNGRLILLTDSASQQRPDTATIVLLRRDSLVLRFSDHEQAYYRIKH